MKIALFDPYLKKFTAPMIDWWTSHGHEVKVSRYYDPSLVQWADLVWFFTADNNLKCATSPDSNPDFAGYDMHEMDLTGKKIIVQPIDIEIWLGHHLASNWDLVDDVVFIADHIREVCMVDTLPARKADLRIHTIPLGIDLDRYTFADRKPGFNIAVISEKWVSKGTDLLLQIAMKLKQIDPRYKIHWLGRWGGDNAWDKTYFEDFVEHHQLPITFYEWIDGDDVVDTFLEDKQYLLHGSHKEAWSAVTAEAAAKGIRPVVHRFYGADSLWGDSGWLWASVDDAVDMITDGEYDSHSYRQYLLNKGYDLPATMARIDNIIKGE